MRSAKIQIRYSEVNFKEIVIYDSLHPAFALSILRAIDLSKPESKIVVFHHKCIFAIKVSSRYERRTGFRGRK